MSGWEKWVYLWKQLRERGLLYESSLEMGLLYMYETHEADSESSSCSVVEVCAELAGI